MSKKSIKEKVAFSDDLCLVVGISSQITSQPFYIALPMAFSKLQFQTMLNNSVHMYLYIIGCIPSRKSPVSGIIESKGKMDIYFCSVLPNSHLVEL